MTLWIILTLMVALAAVGTAVPLVRRYEARTSERDAALAALKEQMADIDAQAASGAITAAEAEGLRTEVRRRLLAEARADEAAAHPFGLKGRTRFAFGMAAVIALAATGIYAMLGRPDLETRPPAAEGPEVQATDIAALIPKIEARVAAAPNDAEGWRMLGLALFQTGRFTEAVNAYRRSVELAPDVPGAQSAYGEALVQAGGGTLTPDAVTAFEAALRIDPKDARARYFMGVLKDQRGDRQGALDDWIALLNEAPADAAWAPELRGFVERIARESGIDVSKRLKPLPGAAAMPGPTPEQMAAASSMPAGDQQAMIRGMVEGLATRLKASPRDADGWIRLMRARTVLGEHDAAAAALRDGLAAFADSPADQARLRDAAKSLGVAGA